MFFPPKIPKNPKLPPTPPHRKTKKKKPPQTHHQKNPNKKLYLDNPTHNIYQPSEERVSLVPVLTEEFASTVGLHSTSCQGAIYHIGLLVHQPVLFFAFLTSRFRGKWRKCHNASVQRCADVYWGGKVGSKAEDNSPLKIHLDSWNLRIWWFLLSFSANQ